MVGVFSNAKIKNLLAFVEGGKVPESALDRMLELEDGKKKLEDELRELNEQTRTHSTSQINGIKGVVRNFFQNFEENLHNASPFRRKELIRQIVDKILVDPDKNEINCYVNQIPKGTLPPTQKYWVLHVAPTGIEPVFQP